MHEQIKLRSFITLRADGWSLARISRKLELPKSTLWNWDCKHRNEIQLLKHLQLEELHEQYLPSPEKQLSRLDSYLQRIEAALAERDFSSMTTRSLLQFSLRLRDRLVKTCEPPPFTPVPLDTGSVTHHKPKLAEPENGTFSDENTGKADNQPCEPTTYKNEPPTIVPF